MPSKVYILDDDLSFAKLLSANLRGAGATRIEIFDNAERFFARREEEPPDLVITDLLMPGMTGIDVTRRLRKEDPHLPIFVLTMSTEISSAIDALKAGASEYLTKPVNIDDLTTRMRRALSERPLLEEAASIEKTRRREFSASAILGQHPRVADIRAFVARISTIPSSTVLLLGESGTGKNLVARAIHYANARAGARFVEINCSALPPQLLEAELFGYQKGAFTDARESKRGLIEVADAGTLFLDEIGDLSPELQAKLLNFLESRRFRRVGGTEEIEVRLRIVTATNRDLEEAVRAGRFRADLYYRICVATHTLPPLREIKGDLPLLADHFREVFNREFRKEVESIERGALQVLQGWRWPGNVRELRNVIERAMIFADGPGLKTGDLPPLDALGASSPEAAQGDAYSNPVGLTLADAEKEYIRRTLAACDGSVQRAAEILGISRKNLWEKRKKYGLPGGSLLRGRALVGFLTGAALVLAVPKPTRAQSAQSAYLDASVSGVWTSPANATGAPDAACAVSGTTENGAQVHIWRWNSGTFSIPSNATINGLVAVVRWGAEEDRLRVELSPDNSAWGTYKQVTASGKVTTCPWDLTLGSSTDLWGGTWTPANINDDVYVRLTGLKGNEGRRVRVDAVQLTVHYTVPAPSAGVELTPDTAQSSRLPSNGTNYTVQFTVQNTGPSTDSYDLLTTKSPGTAVSIVSMTGTGVSQGANPDSARLTDLDAALSRLVTVTYSVGDVAAGTVDTLFFTARSVADASVQDQSRLELTVVRPSLTIAKSVTPSGTQDPGTDLSYTITFTNNGSANAGTVMMVDTISSSVQFKVNSVVNNLPAGVAATVEYSNDAGATWTYVPASGGCSAPTGYDSCVNRVRWRLLNELVSTSPDNTGNVQFVSRIR